MEPSIFEDPPFLLNRLLFEQYNLYEIHMYKYILEDVGLYLLNKFSIEIIDSNFLVIFG